MSKNGPVRFWPRVKFLMPRDLCENPKCLVSDHESDLSPLLFAHNRTEGTLLQGRRCGHSAVTLCYRDGAVATAV